MSMRAAVEWAAHEGARVGFMTYGEFMELIESIQRDARESMREEAAQCLDDNDHRHLDGEAADIRALPSMPK